MPSDGIAVNCLDLLMLDAFESRPHEKPAAEEEEEVEEEVWLPQIFDGLVVRQKATGFQPTPRC